MGTEQPKSVTINVTGFKKFQGVAENPTETIVNNLTSFVQRKGLLPAGVTLGSCTVLETAGDGALPVLYKVLESGTSGIHTKKEHIVWLHLGVDGGAEKFALERQAVNEATFFCPDELGWQPMRQPIVAEDGGTSRKRELHLGVDGGAEKFALERQAVNEATFFCPDELGWQPMRQPIVAEDGGTSRKRETTCSIEVILKFLKDKGYDVRISNDAGLFVCNYVYYHSLRFAEQKGHKSLFVHVPLFSVINEETQMQFVASLLEAIASTC